MQSATFTSGLSRSGDIFHEPDAIPSKGSWLNKGMAIGGGLLVIGSIFALVVVGTGLRHKMGGFSAALSINPALTVTIAAGTGIFGGGLIGFTIIRVCSERILENRRRRPIVGLRGDVSNSEWHDFMNRQNIKIFSYNVKEGANARVSKQNKLADLEKTLPVVRGAYEHDESGKPKLGLVPSTNMERMEFVFTANHLYVYAKTQVAQALIYPSKIYRFDLENFDFDPDLELPFNIFQRDGNVLIQCNVRNKSE